MDCLALWIHWPLLSCIIPALFAYFLACIPTSFYIFNVFFFYFLVYCKWQVLMNNVLLRVRNKSMKQNSRIQLGFEPKTFWILVRRSYHWATWTPGRRAEDKPHKQHFLEASAEFQLTLTLREWNPGWTLQPLKAQFWMWWWVMTGSLCSLS